MTNKWDYSRLITNMKRWSFSSKMKIAFEASRKTMTSEARNPNKLRTMVLPHHIETFIMLGIKEKEWQYKDITNIEFYKSINTISSYQHPQLYKLKGQDWVNWLLIVTAATQFDFQANPIYRLNRYISYFTHVDDNINMPSEIESKFELPYNDIISPIVLLWFYLAGDISFSREQIDWLYYKYKKTFDLLTLSREEYISELNSITSRTEDYLYCLRPSYSWPFIMYEGERYIPTPHLLIRAVTVSIMHRLTYNNNYLRDKIGKSVLESYLYELVKKSDQFQEVILEQEYQNGQKTLDVMAAIDDYIVCFDSKSCSPLIGIRTFDYNAYRRTMGIIVKDVVQAYKHIRYKFGNAYSYLAIPVKSDRSNIYAVVVLADNPFFPLGEVYSAAAEQLNIPIPSEEYDWLRGHVGIADVDAIEIQLFERNNFIEAITENTKTKQYSDNWLLQGVMTQDDEKTEFMTDKVSNLIYAVIEKMQAKGLA